MISCLEAMNISYKTGCLKQDWFAILCILVIWLGNGLLILAVDYLMFFVNSLSLQSEDHGIVPCYLSGAIQNTNQVLGRRTAQFNAISPLTFALVPSVGVVMDQNGLKGIRFIPWTSPILAKASSCKFLSLLNLEHCSLRESIKLCSSYGDLASPSNSGFSAT